MVASASWDALGTWCEVLTVHEDDLPAVADLVRARVDALDAAFARPDSELAGLATGRPQRISPVLALALAAMLRAEEFAGDRTSADRQPIQLDADSGTVTMPPGQVLDLGTSARAWAADWLVKACADDLGLGCLVNLGGDIAVRGEVPEGGWQVEIDAGPAGPQGRPVISMGWPGGLATRSATSGAWRSVTVAARTCERAGAAGEAAVRMDDGAPRWLTQRELPARLVHSGGVVVQTNGWPRERWIA